MNSSFEAHTDLMKNMKKDLDVIFRRIRLGISHLLFATFLPFLPFRFLPVGNKHSMDRDLKVALAGAVPEGIVNLETEED